MVLEKITDKKSRFNLLFLLLWSMVIIGLLYMKGQGIDAADWYLSLAIAAGVMILLILFFVSREDWKQLFAPPLEKNTPQANYNFLMGMVVPIFLYLGVKKLFMPESVIFSQKIFQLYQQPAFSSYFIRTWVAGISEEFLFGIVIVLIGMIAAYYAMRSAKIDTSSPYSKAFIIGIGSLLSVGLFAFFHTLNPTYAGADFIWALVFRFLMNLIIWGLGAFAFAVGYHIMNNSIAIGISILGAGLISIPAIPILILLAIMVWSVFTWRESIDFTLGAVSKARG